MSKANAKKSVVGVPLCVYVCACVCANYISFLLLVYYDLYSYMCVCLVFAFVVAVCSAICLCYVRVVCGQFSALLSRNVATPPCDATQRFALFTFMCEIVCVSVCVCG